MKNSNCTYLKEKNKYINIILQSIVYYYINKTNLFTEITIDNFKTN